MSEKIRIADLPEFDITEHLEDDQAAARRMVTSNGGMASRAVRRLHNLFSLRRGVLQKNCDLP